MPEDHAAALLQGALGEPREVLARAAEAAKPHASEVQLVRAEVVVGPRHVASAARHALRAFARGQHRAQSLGLEFLCYLAGERQIARALEKVGVAAGSREAVGVALGGEPRAALEAVAPALGLRLSWELPARGPQALAALGFGARPQGDPEQQALELVALLDLER